MSSVHRDSTCLAQQMRLSDSAVAACEQSEIAARVTNCMAEATQSVGTALTEATKHDAVGQQICEWQRMSQQRLLGQHLAEAERQSRIEAEARQQVEQAMVAKRIEYERKRAEREKKIRKRKERAQRQKERQDEQMAQMIDLANAAAAASVAQSAKAAADVAAAAAREEVQQRREQEAFEQQKQVHEQAEQKAELKAVKHVEQGFEKNPFYGAKGDDFAKQKLVEENARLEAAEAAQRRTEEEAKAKAKLHKAEADRLREEKERLLALADEKIRKMEVAAQKLQEQKVQRERDEQRQQQERAEERQRQKEKASSELEQARASARKDREQRQNDFEQLLQSVKHKLSDENEDKEGMVKAKGAGVEAAGEDGASHEETAAEDQVREAGYWCRSHSKESESSTNGGTFVSTKLEARLRQFFCENNLSIISTPGKFARLLQIFAGREDELVARLERKYHPSQVPDRVRVRQQQEQQQQVLAHSMAAAAASEGGFIQMAKRGRSTNGPKGTTGVRANANANANVNSTVERRQGRRSSSSSSSGGGGSLPSYMRSTRSQSIRVQREVDGSRHNIHNQLGIDIAQDARYLQRQREWVRAKREETNRAFDSDADEHGRGHWRKIQHSVSAAAGGSTAGQDPFSSSAAAEAGGFIQMKKRGRNTNGPKGSGGLNNARRP